MAEVRALTAGDYDGWASCWQAYLHFYRSELPAEVTADTFDRLVTGRHGLAGLVSVGADGTVEGIANLVFHPTTWSTAPYCYLEDLFVVPSARGTGAAQGLFEAAYAEADRRGASRVYWETQEYNSPARSLYDRVGHRTSFIIYER